MNILFVLKKFPHYGGIAIVTQMLCEQFIADGHHVVVATLVSDPVSEIKELIPDGVIIKRLSGPTWSLSHISILRKIIKEYNVDVMIDQWALRPEVAFICNCARKGSNCKLYCQLHGAPNTTKMIIGQTDSVAQSTGLLKVFNKIKLWAYHVITKLSIKYVYRISDKYILLSNSFIPQLVNYAKLKETSKLQVVENAIQIPADGFVYDFKKKKKQILYVGRMDPFNKRVNRIVEAWEQLFMSYLDWTLELVGEGPQLPDLKTYVTDRNIERVNFHGFQKEPPRKFYEEASVLLLTSDLEGFGLVIIEGMQFGVVPVVYGSYVAVYDIIKDGKDGFITSMPYSRDATIKCMTKLMDNEHLREEMARAAMKTAERYTIREMANKWYRIFDC